MIQLFIYFPVFLYFLLFLLFFVFSFCNGRLRPTPVPTSPSSIPLAMPPSARCEREARTRRTSWCLWWRPTMASWSRPRSPSPQRGWLGCPSWWPSTRLVVVTITFSGHFLFCARATCYLQTLYFVFSLRRRNSDPGSLCRLSPPPHPHYGMRLRLYRDKSTAIYSLVDSLRAAPACPRCWVLSAVFFFFFFREPSQKSDPRARFYLQNQL